MGKFVYLFKCFIVIYLKCLDGPRKCVIINCRSGYLTKKNEPPQDVMNPVFGFPDKTKHPDQWMSWVRFVNRKDWTPGKFDGICAKHFESHYIKVGSKRSK